MASIETESTSSKLLNPNEQKANSSILDFSIIDFSIMGNLILNSIPCIVYIVSNLAILAINLHFIGQTGDAYMIDAVGLSNAWVNCIILGAIMSLNSGLVAIGSQAFGSKNYRLFGIYYHRAIFCSLIVLCGGLVFILLSKQILIVFEVPFETRVYAYQYMLCSMTGYLSFALYDTSRNYLMAQEDYAANLIVQIVSGGAHWGWCYLFTMELGWGVEGLGLATSISFTTDLVLLWIYMFFMTPNKESWFWFCPESFGNILEQLWQEVSIGLMMYMDIVAYEILAIFASSYQTNDLGGWVTAIMVIYIFASFPFGLGAAITPAVGNAVGLGDKALVKKTLWMGILVNIIVISVAWTIFFLTYSDLVGFMSKNQPIDSTADHVCFLYLFILPGDYFQLCIASYLRGIGKQIDGIKCFGIGYYLIGLPTALILGNILGYYDTGLIFGIGVGSYSLLIGLLAVLYGTNIDKQINKIQNRIQTDALTAITVDSKKPVSGSNSIL